MFLDPTIGIPSTLTPPIIPSKLIPDNYINSTIVENDTDVPTTPINLMMGKDIQVAHCARIDTAAEASVTPFIDILHDYKAYDDKCRCPIRLVAALDTNSKVQPKGEGYLHIPGHTPYSNQPCIIRVRCYYSPHLNSTPLNEDDLYGESKLSANNFTGM